MIITYLVIFYQSPIQYVFPPIETVPTLVEERQQRPIYLTLCYCLSLILSKAYIWFKIKYIAMSGWILEKVSFLS
jgi:hypothetical protein